MIKKTIVVFCILNLSITALFSSISEVKTIIDTDSALIGSHFRVGFEFKTDSALQSFVIISENPFPAGFEVLASETDSGFSGENRFYKEEYLLTCFDSGVYKLGNVPVLISSVSGMDTLFSQYSTIVVYSPEVDTTKAIMDIKAPVNTPFRFSELKAWYPYGGGVLLLLLILILIYRGTLKKRDNLISQKPSLPPHILALEKLDQIRKEKLWQKGQVKEYYSELSDTMRIYLENRYNIAAMESITFEILEAFKKYTWDDDHLLEILESLLSVSDLVKFAKEDPSPSVNEMNLNNAYIFIEKTRPVEVTAANEKSED